MSASPSDRELPIWLRPPAILLFIAAVTLIRMVVAAQTGLVRDEGYYALWSTVPSAGYLDHPPMIAWMIAAGRALVGESEAGVRLLPVLSTGVTLLAVYRIGALIFELRSAGIAVIWFGVTVAAGLLFIAAPDAPLVMFWALTIWAVAEFVASRNPYWWLAAGVFAGAALLSKHTGAFLGAGIVLYVFSSRERWPWLRLWQVWAGGAVAVLVFLPNLLWNIQNGWASFAFQGRRLGSYGLSFGSLADNLRDLVAGQALATGVVLFGFVLLAILVFAFNPAARRHEGLALAIVTSLPLVLYFLAYTARLRVEANWVVAVWPVLALAGAWAAMHFRPAHPVLGWPLAVLRWMQVPLGLILVGLIYAQALWQPFDLPQHIDRTRDMRGWDGVQLEVAALARAHDARWIVAGDYGLTGQLATYGRFAGTDLPVRNLQSPARWTFLPPLDPSVLNARAVFVHRGGTNLERVQPLFARIEPLAEVRRMQGEEVLERFAAYLVSEPQPQAIEALSNR